MTLRRFLTGVRFRYKGGLAFPSRVVLAAVLLTGLAGSVAYADQNNWFTIWAYNTDMWTGTANNYHIHPFCVGSCPYDYMIPMNAEVKSATSGSFSWEVFELAVGQVFTGGCCPNAWKGHLWVYDASGTLIADSSTFMCEEVRTYGSLVVGTLAANSTSHWDQDSGAGGAVCDLSYPGRDRWIITAP